MRVVLLALLLAVAYRLAGRWLWRRWRYGGTDLPADLWRASR